MDGQQVAEELAAEQGDEAALDGGKGAACTHRASNP